MTQIEANRISIAAAQLLMRAEISIDPDGKWGSYTQSVYERLTPSRRIAVDTMLQAGGTSASELRAARAAQKAAGIIAQSSVKDVQDAINAAADEAGIERRTLLGFAKIESNLNPSAVNGSSRGLMQMQPAAWADAKKALPSLPEYNAGVFDALQNARAGATYLKLNSRAILRAGYKGQITPAVLYLAHQQGAAGFVELWRASQSMLATTQYVTPKAMTGNPPPDGRGATTSKKEFFDRWLAVAERKIGM